MMIPKPLNQPLRGSTTKISTVTLSKFKWPWSKRLQPEDIAEVVAALAIGAVEEVLAIEEAVEVSGVAVALAIEEDVAAEVKMAMMAANPISSPGTAIGPVLDPIAGTLILPGGTLAINALSPDPKAPVAVMVATEDVVVAAVDLAVVVEVLVIAGAEVALAIVVAAEGSVTEVVVVEVLVTEVEEPCGVTAAEVIVIVPINRVTKKSQKINPMATARTQEHRKEIKCHPFLPQYWAPLPYPASSLLVRKISPALYNSLQPEKVF